MRTQSQKRSRLIADLAEKAGREDTAGLAVVRSLRKETAAVAKEWAALASEARSSRLTRPRRRRVERPARGLPVRRRFRRAGAFGRRGAERLLLRKVGAAAPSDADAAAAATRESPSKEAQRLRKKCAELQKKVRYLEGQIAKTKDVEKANKRDLLQRKGELAEARMLAERLRKELEESRGARAEPRAAAKPPAAMVGIEEIDQAVKRLATEQRRLLAPDREDDGRTPPPPAAFPEPTKSLLRGPHRAPAGRRRA